MLFFFFKINQDPLSIQYLRNFMGVLVFFLLENIKINYKVVIVLVKPEINTQFKN